MKSDIHPKLHEANVICACGNTFTAMSVSKEIKVETCSECHPFFTGTQRFMDIAGRIEKFNRKFKKVKRADELAEEVAEETPAEA